MAKYIVIVFIFFISQFGYAQTAKTFNGTGGNIPDNATSKCFTTNVTGVGVINDSYGIASVCINITHSADEELIIYLKSPDGTEVNLSNGNGGTKNNYTNTCFTFTATTPIGGGTAPFTGTFKPDDNFGILNNGQNANGSWSLCIEDANSGTNTGKLLNWSILFNNTPAPRYPPPTIQDCPAAISICQNIYDLASPYPGQGNYGSEINYQNSCLEGGEVSDVWYTFTVQNSGNLSFLLTPKDATEDYDWAVYNLTNATCADIYTDPGIEVSCNWSGTQGPTGPTGAFGATATSQGIYGTTYNAKIPVKVGETYVINVSNYSKSTHGYKIDFSSSSAKIFDNTPPTLKSVFAQSACGGDTVGVNFSENIPCTGIQASDFTVTGPDGTHTVTGWQSAACSSGATYGNNLLLAVNPPITADGNYNLCLTGNSIADNCGNTATPGCLPFVVGRPHAGNDQAVCLNQTATMGATGTGTWKAQTGNPATATITTASSPNTTITHLTVAGDYYFIWDNGACTDTAKVTVTAKPNAGGDQVACMDQSATMAATGTGTWTAQAGNPATASITTVPSPTTTITGLTVAGIYYFIWGNGSCTDTAKVTVTAKPNAGGNQAVCMFQPATMAANGTGTWTAQTGNPSTANITTASAPNTTITGLTVAGDYYFIWSNNSCADTAIVTVTTKPDAGGDQVACMNQLATMAAIGTGTWTAQAGNPAAATITTASSPNTTITGLTVAGVYYFIWDNGSCKDTAKVTVTAKPNAGNNQVVCMYETATMGASGTGVWTAQTGNPAAATITTASAPNTTITGLTVAGDYYFIWSDNSCTDTAKVTVMVKPNAGSDEVVCINQPVTMTASGTGTWTAQTSNPATANINTVSSPTTTITGLTVTGVYYFIWDNGSCKDTAKVTVTAKPDAGSDQVVCMNQPATMAAIGTGTWIAKAGNPATATITTASSPNTTITGLSAAGIYYFIWGNGSCTDTAKVTVMAKPNAGGDQVTCLNQSATMAANGTGTWTAQAGNPATANITIASSPNTTITGLSVAGNYYFIWDDGSCTDTAKVTVTPKPNAGNDQVVCLNQPATMAAAGTGTWIAQTGNPATTVITTVSSPTTTITGLSVAGDYYFIWGNGSCTDTAKVTVMTKPNAGGDQIACINQPATMAAIGTGTWTAQAGNPTAAIITTPSSSNTTITGLTVAGFYYFIWGDGSCTDTAKVTVLAKPNAGTDQLACINQPATMVASGTGTWAAQPGNPAAANITTISSPNTTITGLSVIGDYYFIWNNGSCTDTAKVTVMTKPNAGNDQIVCMNQPATMAATGTGTWIAQTGNPTAATITTISSPNTTITGLTVAGVYNFIWNNGSCTDTAKVTVLAKPNAGIDQVVCMNQPATMAATGTGTWTAQTGNPAAATITTTSSPNTTITGLNVVGNYYFIWNNGSCPDTAKVTVMAKPDAGADQVACMNQPATMAATGTGTWTAQTGNPATAVITTASSPNTNITGLSIAGNYYFIWNNGSCTDTAKVTVTAKPDAGNDQIVCINQPATMAAVGTGIWVAQTGNPAVATITTASSPNTTITNLSAVGSYYFIWENGASCTDTVMLSVINPVLPIVVPQITYCQNQKAETLTATATGQLHWYTSSVGGVGSTLAPTPSTSSTGEFHYFVSQGSGSCEGPRAEIIVTVSSKPDLGIDKELTICYAASGDISTLYNTTGLINTWSYNGVATSDITAVTEPGYYKLISSYSGGTCSDTAIVRLVVRPPVIADAGRDGNAEYNIPYQLKGSGGKTYEWSPAGVLNDAHIAKPVATITTDTYFTLKVQDASGCSDTDGVKLRILKGPTFYIPTAFSPNGDGLNDVFIPQPVGIKSLEYFRVFNRYGEMVYETQDLSKGWDGTYKGQKQDPASYVWMLKGIDRTGAVQAMSGYIVLVR